MNPREIGIAVQSFRLKICYTRNEAGIWRDNTRMRKPLFILTTLAIAATAFALASASAASSGPTSTDASRSTLTVRGSSFGRILFDGRGFALYAFTRDKKGPSRCYGACALAWPPYIVSKRALASAGVKRSLIGTVRRGDGKRQVTYAGRPLYYYVGDRKAGQVLCQNVNEYGGLWLVVRGSGKLVR
jgi:predicted lipoprotein with Yx(FWY)xxD motif